MNVKNPQIMSQGKAVVAIFSGCGGLDLGFREAGFNIVWASEYDKEQNN